MFSLDPSALPARLSARVGVRWELPGGRGAWRPESTRGSRPIAAARGRSARSSRPTLSCASGDSRDPNPWRRGSGAQAIEERGHSQLDEPPHTDLSLGSDFSLMQMLYPCLLYTSDAADDLLC